MTQSSAFSKCACRSAISPRTNAGKLRDRIVLALPFNFDGIDESIGAPRASNCARRLSLELGCIRCLETEVPLSICS